MTSKYDKHLLDLTQNDLIHQLRDFIARTPGRDENSHALLWAALKGKTEYVEALMDVSDVSAFGNQALDAAVEQGHLACVQLLFSKSDCNLYDSALRAAVAHDQNEVLEWLLQQDKFSNRTFTLCFLNLSSNAPNRDIFNTLYGYGGREPLNTSINIKKSQLITRSHDYIAVFEEWANEEDGKKISAALDGGSGRCTSSRKI